MPRRRPSQLDRDSSTYTYYTASSADHRARVSVELVKCSFGLSSFDRRLVALTVLYFGLCQDIVALRCRNSPLCLP